MTGEVISLDETKNLWYSKFATLPTRSDPAAIEYLNHLIVIARFDGRQSVDIDVSSNQWSRAASLPYTITSATPLLLSDVLCLAGGLAITNGKLSPRKSFTCISVPIVKSTSADSLKGITTSSYNTTIIHGDSLFTLCGRDPTSNKTVQQYTHMTSRTYGAK